jgi:hypothetical protein
MLSCFVRVARNANRFQITIFLDPDWTGFNKVNGFQFEFGFRKDQKGKASLEPGKVGVPNP